MAKILFDLDLGEIHFRDSWQFEVKSDFIPSPDVPINHYEQEFYLFIPNSLQINADSYTKEDFFQDRTKFIRFKTPEYTIDQLADDRYPHHPLSHLESMIEKGMTKETLQTAEYELKLFANILRSSLRTQVGILNEKIEKSNNPNEINNDILKLSQELMSIRKRYTILQKKYEERWKNSQLNLNLYYVDEFISDTISYYLMEILEVVRSSQVPDAVCDSTISSILASENKYRYEHFGEKPMAFGDSHAEEYYVYRRGLLSKYILDALQLNISTSSWISRYSNVIGGIAAGIAMFAYSFTLFLQTGSLLQGSINSLFLVALTVILYILKDRIKEGIKTLSVRNISRYFPDYTTIIKSPDNKIKLGKVHESFSFISESRVPHDVSNMRNREFHEVLEAIKRPEQVIFYKRIIDLKTDPQHTGFQGYNIIFRFNIQRFLNKAANPYTNYLMFDNETQKLVENRLPKVYHINIIMKNTYKVKDAIRMELKKFRLVVDKKGIKHIDQLRRQAPEDSEP
jgi:hypothetical protein